MSNIVEVNNLVKRYGKTKVIDNLNLKVPEGSIFAFLGANGAGKTTTIKILLNLIKNDEGGINIFGKDLQEHKGEILQSIGSLVEGPAFYPNLSAYENLKIFASIKGSDIEEIPEVLKKVNLFEVKDRALKNYSLGMKQRVGIAIALLGDPKLLILDEPTNGLDPKGMHEIRELISNLAKEGKTILISSHILGEIELIATDYAIIKNGKLIFNGSSEELKKLDEKVIYIKTDDNIKSINILKSENIECSLEGDAINVYGDLSDAAYINRMLVLSNINVCYLAERKRSLEDIFLSLTNGEE